MGSIRQTIFYYSCLALCMIVTLGFSIQCLLKYLENEDVSKTSIHKFHQKPENRYPVTTLCFKNPFIEKKLKYYGKSVDIASYLSFLNGKLWSERMLSIDYDNVTVSLHDNLLGISMQLLNDGKRYMYNHVTGRQQPLGFKPDFYVNVRTEIRKCFGFEIPYVEKKQVFNFVIYIHNNFYPKGFRTPLTKFNESNPDSGGLLVYFHYPGQFETSYYTSIGVLNGKDNQSEPYTMKFTLKDVSVIKRRNKPNDECIEDWQNYDQIIWEDIMKKANCRPKYRNTKINLKTCSTKDEIKRYIDEKRDVDWNYLRPPCRSIQNMEASYSESEFQSDFEPSSDFMNVKGF